METATWKMSDGKGVFCRKWMPAGSGVPDAVVHIVHGLGEHSNRYQWVAEKMAGQGMGVYAHDHRGHGKTAGQPGRLGFFAENNGWDRVVSDVKEVGDRIRQENPAIPFFLFGHSMGSFLSRDCLGRFDAPLAGAIFSGTAGPSSVKGKAGAVLARLCTAANGVRSPSPLMDKLVFMGYLKKFKPARTPFDWLSRDPAQVDAYINDPLCGVMNSAGLFRDLISGVGKVNHKGHMAKTPAGLPIYLFSGSMDPVGGYSKGVLAVDKAFRNSGVTDVTVRIYDGGRHEMLNEINREEVAEDMIRWIREHL